MASYWKSPYKEKTQPVAYTDNFNTRSSLDSFIPLGSRTYCGLNKVKHFGPISPQDWFDWALSVTNNKFNPYAPSGHQPRGRIKGILKSAPDTDASECEKTGPDSESVASVVSDSAASKKEKKRVTFGETYESEYTFGARYPTEKPITTSNERPKQGQILDNFVKKTTTKKTASYPTDSGNLQSIKSTSTVTKDSGVSSSSCRHSPDLRCAQCATLAENVSTNVTPSEAMLETPQFHQTDGPPVNDPKLASAFWPESTQTSSVQVKQHIELSLQSEKSTREPLKKYTPHWTKTFLRTNNKRQCTRPISRKTPSITLRNLPRGTSESSNHEPTNKKMKSNKLSEDFSKLSISVDGKMVQTKIDPRDIPTGAKQNSNGCHKNPKSAVTVNPTLEAIAVAPVEPNPSPRQNTSATRLNSAPSRLRLGDASSDSKIEPCLDKAYLDKTSQILSWLNDVKSKSRFKPSIDRSYPLQSTQLRH